MLQRPRIPRGSRAVCVCDVRARSRRWSDRPRPSMRCDRSLSRGDPRQHDTKRARKRRKKVDRAVGGPSSSSSSSSSVWMRRVRLARVCDARSIDRDACACVGFVRRYRRCVGASVRRWASIRFDSVRIGFARADIFVGSIARADWWIGASVWTTDAT